jgi:Skp family chaperone for outer membrane proteins
MTLRNVKTVMVVLLVVGLMGSGVGALRYHASTAPAAEQTGSAPHPLAPPAVGTRSLHTRIGLINMARVLKDSKLGQTVEADLRRQTQQLQKDLASLRKQLQHNSAVYLDPATAPREKERLNRDFRLLQRDMQEEEAAARAKLAELNGKACIRVYRAVEDAANRIAKSQDLELVMFYTDAVTEADYYSPENMQHKLTQSGVLMPMVVAPGMDITETVIAALNHQYDASRGK